MVQSIVKCAFCGNGVSKTEASRHKNKNYHPDCLEKQLEKEDLVEYICKLFSLKAPGPRIYTQIRNFLSKYQYYTYKGIKQALTYFYEVQNKPVEKANQGIGIVPYVYDDAQKYYNSIILKQENVANDLTNAFLIDPKEIIVKKQKEKKNLYDIENL